MTMRARSGLLGNSVGGKPNSRPFRKNRPKILKKHAENAQKSVKGRIFCDFTIFDNGFGYDILCRNCDCGGLIRMVDLIALLRFISLRM